MLEANQLIIFNKPEKPADKVQLICDVRKTTRKAGDFFHLIIPFFFINSFLLGPILQPQKKTEFSHNIFYCRGNIKCMQYFWPPTNQSIMTLCL